MSVGARQPPVDMEDLQQWAWGSELGDRIEELKNSRLSSSGAALNDYEDEHDIALSRRLKSKDMLVDAVHVHALTGERFFNSFVATEGKPSASKSKTCAKKRRRRCMESIDLPDSFARLINGQAPTTLSVKDTLELFGACESCGAVDVASFVIDVCFKSIMAHSSPKSVRIPACLFIFVGPRGRRWGSGACGARVLVTLDGEVMCGQTS